MKKHKNKLTFIGVLLVVLSFLSVGYVLFQNKSLYTKRFDPVKFKTLYEQSQWRDPLSKKPISDETLYSYAGYQYVHGTNPILINSEAPPLGKYLIGLSISLFGNEKIINIILALGSLIMIGIYVFLESSSFFSSSIALLLTATSSLFIDQLIHNPQLEIMQVFFILAFLIFVKLFEKKHSLFLSIAAGISLGSFLSIKTFTYHFGLAIAVVFLFLLFK